MRTSGRDDFPGFTAGAGFGSADFATGAGVGAANICVNSLGPDSAGGVAETRLEKAPVAKPPCGIGSSDGSGIGNLSGAAASVANIWVNSPGG